MATIFEECITEYWQGNPSRCKKYVARLSPVFDNARSRVNKNMLEVLNDRRYKKIIDPVKRMKLVNRDPKMKQVDNIIFRTGKKSLQIIQEAQPEVYNEEAPLQAKCWDKSTPNWASFTVGDITNKELQEIMLQPYLGKTYKQWAMGYNVYDDEGKFKGCVAGYTQNAIKSWESSFRAVQNGKIQKVGQVQSDVQLLSDAHKALDTMESRSKTVMENACINTARFVDKEFLVSTGQA